MLISSAGLVVASHPCRNPLDAQGLGMSAPDRGQANQEENAMPASYQAHRGQLKAILLAWGMPEANAETTAEILSWADLHGVDSHGMSMIPGYDGLRRSGRARMDARPEIVRETPVSAVVDGGGGLGHVPAHFAMNLAIDKAKKAGM